jgi:copper resistance protein D
MSGQPLQAEILKTVWTQTQFGMVWKIRLFILLIATIVALFSCFIKSRLLFPKLAIWLQFILNGCLLGSLAWAGHGQESSPWHLFADVIHLLAAGIWPAGLIPLFLILRKSRQFAAAADWFDVAALVSRFSTISLSAVSLLVFTGIVNSWFLVGSLSNLFGQPYGHWLLAKIIMFCVILVIAAVNLLRLKPRLITESSQRGKARATAARLQTNVQIELFLGLAIVVIVAILGILPPAIH